MASVELCGRHVVAVAVEAALVEQVHPGEGLQLELADVVPHRRRVRTRTHSAL